MFSQKEKEIPQKKTVERFNDLHKDIIESVIKVHLNDIIQTFIAEPERAKEALYAILTGVQEEDKPNLDKILDSLEAVRYIITHEAPQDLLKLNNRIQRDKDKDISLQLITKTDVVAYIVQRVFDTSNQFSDLKELMPFIQKNKEAIQALLKSCDAFTIDQFPKIGKKGLATLIKYPTAIHVLFDQINMPVQAFLNLKETIRNEFIEHALDLANFKVASISWQEILSLSDATRVLFYKHTSSIVDLMQNKKTTFHELKTHADTLDEFIAEKKNPSEVVKLPQTKPVPPKFELKQTKSITPTNTPASQHQFDQPVHSERQRREEESRRMESQIHRNLLAIFSQINITNINWLININYIFEEDDDITSNELSDEENDIHPANPTSPTQSNTFQDLVNFPPLDPHHPHPFYWPTNPHATFSNASIFSNRPLENSIIVDRPEGMWWIENKSVVQLSHGLLINNAGTGSVIVNPANGWVRAQFNRQEHTLTHFTAFQNGYVAACEHDCENIYVYDDIMSDHITLNISHQGYVTHLFSMDKYLIVFDASRRPISVYDIHSGNLVNCINNPYRKDCLLISQDKILLIATDAENTKYCQWINPLTSEILRQEKLQDQVVQRAIFLPDGKLAIANFSSKIYIYNLEGRRENILSHKFKVAHMQVINSLALSERGHLLVGDSEGRIQEYNYMTGECLHAFRCRDTGRIGTPITLQMLFKRLTALQPAPEMVPMVSPSSRRNNK